ncbi:type IV pilus secretin PilQ [Myxococcota bacterium]|nr:type IV pilus secretin PilQ [Myxococcota bacterium]
MDRSFEDRSSVHDWKTLVSVLGIGVLSLVLFASGNPSRAEGEVASLSEGLVHDSEAWSGQFKPHFPAERVVESSVESETSWEIAPLESVKSDEGATDQATELLRVDTWSARDGEGETIHLVADGPVASVSAFTVENPNRLVVDLLGLHSSIKSSRIQVGSSRVERVRIGVHDDKVRVVLDGGSSNDVFDGRSVSPIGSGLLIALGRGAQLADHVLAIEGGQMPPSRSSDETELDEVIAALRAEVAKPDDTEVLETQEMETSRPTEVDPAEQTQRWLDLAAVADVDFGESLTDPSASEPGTLTNSSEPKLEPAPETLVGSPASKVGVPELATSETKIFEADTLAGLQAPEAAEPEFDSADSDVETVVGEVWNLAGREAAPIETAPLVEPAIRANTESPVETDPMVHVYAVDLVSQDDLDRIIVYGDRPSDYRLYEPDPETLVVSFDDARISHGEEVRIAPEQSGPVSLVTAFQQPDVSGSEVRVVIKRASNAVPRIERVGSQLLFEFPRAGEIASPPPVLAALAATETKSVGTEMFQADDDANSSPASEEIEITEATESLEPTASVELTEPEAVPAALEPPAAIAILNEGGFQEGKQYTGRRISLDFKDVNVADVLRLVAEVSDLNVVAGDEVSGQVTVRLVDVPWDQALDVILLTKGLGFERVGNVLRVAPATVLKQEEELRLQERRNLEALEDLVVKLQPINYANVQDVSNMVQRLLTPRGTVNVDARTNTLIIKDIASVVDEATALVKAIDTQTPQVMIEAKIVEANLDFSREFGSSWSVGTQPLIDGFDSGSGARRDLGNSDFLFHDTNNFSFGNPVAATSGVFNLAAFVVDEKMNLDLTLQAAEANGDGKVISSPRIVTLDNTRATIEQGVSIPFQTFENGDAQLEFVDAVLKLNVTPHITGDKSIIMKIEVSRNAPDDSVFTLTGSPAIAKNQVKTETLVSDGQTLVLGGIYVIDRSDTSQGVPLLKDVPGLGWAFKNKIIKDNRKELLMFVSPRIVMTAPDAS